MHSKTIELVALQRAVGDAREKHGELVRDHRLFRAQGLHATANRVQPRITAALRSLKRAEQMLLNFYAEHPEMNPNPKDPA